MCIRDSNDIEEKETTIDELIDVVKGPDFPTGGIILGTRASKRLTDQAAAK